METQSILRELEDVAQRHSAKVSYEALRASVGTGGFCKVNGQPRIIIDRRATPEERIATLAHCLNRLELTESELSERVAELVKYYAVRRPS